MQTQQTQKKFDYHYKLIIVGDSGVGKTNILCRYCQKQFVGNYLPTIGIEFQNKIVQVNDFTFKLSIWDTAGQERYRSMGPSLFKGAQGAILVYSINDLNTFQSIEDWLTQINNYAAEGIPIVLLGNKLDLKDSREVSDSMLQDIAGKFQLCYAMETSAKTGENIEEAFKKLVFEIKNIQEINKSQNISLFRDSDIGIRETVSLGVFKKDSDNKKKCC